ncbi:MAG: YitT family protein [Lachnospiraceae bacterium]|nr:YitT family protein [Lachnospiraceae bacterium]
MKQNVKREVLEYLILTLATVVLIIGVYFFKFPNAFSFGGVTGMAIVLAKFISASPSTITFVINMALLLLGFLFLGKSFGIKTVYVSVLMSVGLSALEWIYPMSAPLTNEPVLELVFAIFLPSVSAAIMFNLGASGGGTDIVAMILKKYTSWNIGTALMMVDLAIVISACFVFDITTGLFSLCGLLAKSLVIDDVIENINLCKCFTIISENPEPITKYINEHLKRSATIYKAEGAYTHTEKTVIITVLKRSQAVQLRNFIRVTEPTAFITITKSSEIIGKGFRGFN